MDIVYGLLDFAAKALLIFVTFAACVAFAASRMRRRQREEPVVRLREIGARWKHNAEGLKRALLSPRARKEAHKAAQERDKQEAKAPPVKPSVFVIDFKGDPLATGVDTLREEVTAILGAAAPDDEVVVRLESAGGTVHGYGLAAAQLARLRARSIPLTVCVDKVAASGGYMMACVAGRIVAAPFAILGSIGVVAAVPNIHRILEKWGVDYEDVTSGKYKRTVSLLGPIKEEGRAKLKEQIEETHDLFKHFVAEMRPSLDVESVATGETWYGSQAVQNGLVDAVATSDDILLERSQTARVFEVLCEKPRSPRERIFGAMEKVLGYLR